MTQLLLRAPALLLLAASLLLVAPLAAQPMLVRDINPNGSSVPAHLTSFNGVLFFVANDGSNGNEVWRSDGTENGTVLVKDINPGATTGAPAIPAFGSFFGALNDALYFAANDGSSGVELWRTDGTEGGTALVADINSGANASGPFGFTEFGGMLYFRAVDATNGTELWKSDGTESGTVLVKDVWPGTPGGIRSIPEFTPFDGMLYFSGDDGANGLELWKTDGTESGTTLVKDIRPGAMGGIRNEEPSDYTVFSGALYFAADDGTSGRELWRSDGTEGGTVLVADINPGAASSEPTGLTVLDGVLYFAADDGTNGRELWKSDGSESGTMLVANISAGSGSSDPAELIVFDDMIFFMADDGASGLEVWKSDGTDVGTGLLTDINPGSSGIGFTPSPFAVFESALYFTANDGTNGLEVWTSDGTESNTMLVADINPGSGAAGGRGLTVAGGSLFFQANDGTNGQELWVLPGTGTGTSVEFDVEPTPFGLSVYPNPTSGRATVELTVSDEHGGAAAQRMRVVVYDVLGRQLMVLHDGPMAVGRHTLTFDRRDVPGGAAGAYPRDLPGGLYFVRLAAGEFSTTSAVTVVDR